MRIPVVHERRRFTDVMDEQVSDERKRTSVDRYTAGFVRSRMETCSLDMPRRVKQEAPVRIYDETVALQQGTHYGKAPFIREKPETSAFTPGEPLVLHAIFTGDPEPVVQWFKSDVPVVEDERVTVKTTAGNSTLSFIDCHACDVGLYKVVAKNTLGNVLHRFRLLHGRVPGTCEPPEVTDVSDSEAMVRWTPPIDDGGSNILCYELQMREKDDAEWKSQGKNIDHEFYLAKKLKPNTLYQFRVAANNTFGWGELSAYQAGRTAAPGPGAPKLCETGPEHILQQDTDAGKAIVPHIDKKFIDYRRETEPVKVKHGENAELQMMKYQMAGELSRGRFSITAKSIRTDDHRTFAVKLLDTSGREDPVKEELDILKSLRHERIAQLYEAYKLPGVTMLIMELLAGIDVLTYFASKHQYSEQHIAIVANQTLDALSYLHWRGYCHLDVQPDNIVLTSPRTCDVKLVDLGSTKFVAKAGTEVSPNMPIDFTAPEVLSDHKAYPTSDVWSLGVLLYTLLAGKPTFTSMDEEDTRQNILNVKYQFDHCSSSVTQEAVRFLMLIFKKDPSKRPMVEDCREHKWLVENDYIIKKRQRALFWGTQLHEYDATYHKRRAAVATTKPHMTGYGFLQVDTSAD